MRYIYLLRHENPGMPDDPKRCLGSTDVSVSDYGKKRIKLSKEYINSFDWKKVYSSPLKRCIETAEGLGIETDSIEIRPDLREMEAGIWENLTFNEIKEKYPDLYEIRGDHLGTYAVEGAESFEKAGKRFEKCLNAIRKESEEDILVITHAGVIKGFLCHLTGKSLDDVMDFSIPYGSITILEEQQGTLRLRETGICNTDLLDDDEIKRIYQKCKTPERVILHMKKVAEVGQHIINKLQEKTGKYPIKKREILYNAALLHDILRKEPNHAKKAADFLKKEGYQEIADIIALHHSDKYIDERDEIELHEILFYADKLVQEDRCVSLEERFSKSLEKYKGNQEAEERHKKLYEKALLIKEKLDIVTK